MEYLLAMELVKNELERATQKFGEFKSPHEGVAIIEEEFLEFREAVFWTGTEGKIRSPQREAVQLAAMAIRYLVDLY